MESVFSVLVAAFYIAGVYLMLSRHTIRILLGVAVFGNGVNLTIFTAGRLTRETPPVIPYGESVLGASAANPLPQALVLTAIVIAFSLFAFLLVLAYRSYQELRTDDTREMRLAEPKDEGLPPMGY